MELPRPQLALDPCVTKVHDSSPATVSLLGFFTGHVGIGSSQNRPSKVKLVWPDLSKFTSFFLFQRKENNHFGDKVPTLGVERTPGACEWPPNKAGDSRGRYLRLHGCKEATLS